MKIRHGWVPYEADDEDVVFRSPLTSLASLTDQVTAGNLASAAVYPVSGNTNTYDSVKGFKAGASGGLTFALSAANAALVDRGFQISLEVERKLLVASPLDSSRHTSDGDVIAGEQRILEAFSGAIPTGQIQLLKVSLSTNDKYATAYLGTGNGLANIFWDFIDGPASSTHYLHSVGKGDFVTVNIGSHGRHVYYAFDGCIYGYAERLGVANFLNWVLGNDRGASKFVENHYVRNIQLVARPPIFSCPPLFSHCYVVSDSIFDSLSNYSQDAADAIPRVGATRPLHQRGLRWGKFTISENGGATITAGADDLDADLDTAIAARPSVLYFRGGHNDISQGLSLATTYSTLQDYIERALGQNGNPHTTIQRFVMGNMTSWMGASVTNTAQNLSDVIDWNILLDGLVAWWDITYPAAAGQVVLADNFNDLGGENPEPLTYIGQVSGSFTDFHMHAYGGLTLGDSYTKALLNSVSAI